MFYILLLGLMGFYFNQAIRLKQKAINNTAQEKMDALLEQKFYKGISLSKESELYAHFMALKQNKTTLDRIKKNYNNSSAFFTTKVDSTFKDLGYQVAAKFSITQITLNDKKINLLDEPFTFLETTAKVVSPRKINTSEWEINETSTPEEKDQYDKIGNKKDLHITVHQEKEIEVLNYLQIAIMDLLPLLLGSILICIFILVLYYITYKTIKQKEREVHNLYNMVDNVSHEFKLPIATLKYGCNNLAKEYESPTINLLLRQIDRLDRLQNKLNPSLNNTKDEHFTKNTYLKMLEDIALTSPQVHFEIDWLTQEWIPFSKTNIETILLNLIENSIKYGSSTIQCCVDFKNNNLNVVIKDNGIGISKDQQKDVFKKFYRIREGNIHNTTGLGIGLYQVKQLIDTMHGTISLTSKEQVGTTIKIKIPNE